MGGTHRRALHDLLCGASDRAPIQSTEQTGSEWLHRTVHADLSDESIERLRVWILGAQVREIVSVHRVPIAETQDAFVE